MNDWAEAGYPEGIEAEPIDVSALDVVDVEEIPRHVISSTAVLEDEAKVLLAPAEAERLQASAAALAAAQARAEAAEDAVADAQGALRVATARAAEHAADETTTWQAVAAEEEVAKASRALARREKSLADSREAVQSAARRVEAARAAFDQTAQGALADDSSQPEAGPTLYFGSVDEFVREYLCQVYRRRVDGRGQTRVWAAEWWRYDEAVIRLEALWRAWEHLRQDPATGMSVWWRDHADHHMNVLFNPESGPFGRRAQGEINSNGPDDPLPYAPPPPGMFPDVREQARSTGA